MLRYYELEEKKKGRELGKMRQVHKFHFVSRQTASVSSKVMSSFGSSLFIIQSFIVLEIFIKRTETIFLSTIRTNISYMNRMKLM